MDVYSGIKYFLRVVETESFSVCAREYGVTPSSITRTISALEDHLGIPLLHRTTRRVVPTEAGRNYFPRAKRVIGELEEAHLDISSLTDKPKGTLKITAPVALGQSRLAPQIPKFLAKYPELDVEMAFDDEYVDLLKESIDVGIRVGLPKDSTLRVRKLEDYRRTLCASPIYLSQRGTPKISKDLIEHDCLTFNFGPGSRAWYYKSGSKATEVNVRGPLHVNSLDALLASAKKGHGITLLPRWSVIKDIRAGNLVEILPDTVFNISPDFAESVYAVYVGQKPSAKVRAFIDFILEEFRR